MCQGVDNKSKFRPCKSKVNEFTNNKTTITIRHVEKVTIIGGQMMIRFQRCRSRFGVGKANFRKYFQNLLALTHIYTK